MATRKENETREERERRRAEKLRKVGQHRAQILKRANAQQGRSRLHKREDFVCPVRFENTLPEVPVEAKNLAYPFDEDILYAYDLLNGVSSESAAPRAFHPEPDLGVGINLIDPLAYTIPSEKERGKLHPLDAVATSSEFARPAARKVEAVDSSRVEWLLLSQHLHNDLYDAVYKHGDSVAVQQKDLDRKKAALARMYGGSREERIAKSFEACGPEAVLRHPTNAGLQPVAVWELLPDPDRWGLPYVAVTFDADPDDATARKSRKLAPLAPPVKRARLEHSLIRAHPHQAVSTRDSSTVVNFMLPEAEEVDPASHPGGATAEPLHVSVKRDYSMVVEKLEPGAGDELLAFVWDDATSTVSFAPIDMRASLTRVKAREEHSGEGGGATAAVHRRGLTPEEADDLELKRVHIEQANPAPRLLELRERKEQREAAARAAVEARLAARDGSRGGSGSGSGSGFGSGGLAGVKRPADDMMKDAVAAVDEDSDGFDQEED